MIASADQIRDALCAREEHRGLPWISETTTPAQRAAMARVCASCPVRAACATEAVTTPTTAGFWAGHDLTLWPEPSALVAVQDALPGLDLPEPAAA